MTSPRAFRVTSAAVVIAAVAMLAGCGGSAESTASKRSVTTDEAQLLAITRFKNFDAGTRSVSFELTDAGHSLSADGWFDYETGVGYAALTDGGVPNSLITWTVHTLAVHPATDGSAQLPPPGASDSLDSSWQRGALDPRASTLHAALVLVAEMGRDRPENPLLVQQGGATWLRSDSVDAVRVTVFGGPTGNDDPSAEPRVRYWIDETGLMLRVEALLGVDWIVFDFSDAGGVTLDYAVDAPS